MDTEMLAQIQQMIEAATGTLRQEIAGLAMELREEIADSKRHTGVLVEGLRHELQLVAEGVQMHVEQRHQEDRRYMDHQFRETRALIQLSYGQLNERIEGLEVRVQSLEQRQTGRPSP